MVLAAPGLLFTSPPASSPPKTPHRSYSAQIQSSVGQRRRGTEWVTAERADVDAAEATREGAGSPDARAHKEAASTLASADKTASAGGKFDAARATPQALRVHVCVCVRACVCARARACVYTYVYTTHMYICRAKSCCSWSASTPISRITPGLCHCMLVHCMLVYICSLSLSESVCLSLSESVCLSVFVSICV